MRKLILSVAMIGFLFSCSEEKKAESTIEETNTEEVVEGKFYCPMKCEGGKTYTESGKCGECGMDLVSDEDSNEESMEEEHDHDHEGHSH